MLVPPNSGVVRFTRGLVWALTGLVLGALAHVVAGGHPPGVFATVLSFIVLALVGLALAEFKRGFAFIAAVLGGGQLFLHLIFSYESAPSIVVTEPGHAVLVRSGGGHAAKAAETATAYAPQAADVASWGSTVSWGSTMSWGSTVSWGSTMTLAHIGAMLVAAALMAHGERAVWRLAHMVLPLLWVWLSPVAPFVARPRPVSEPAAFVPRFGALLARNRPRRGPPLYGLS